MNEIRCKHCKKAMTWAEQKVQFGRLIKNNYKIKLAKLSMPLCQKCNTIFIRKEKAMIKMYKDGDHMGILTDCKDERDFMGQVSEVFAKMIQEKKFESDWLFQFEYWLPQIVDICCKYRGYKNTVIQKVLLRAGDFKEGESDLVSKVEP